MKSISKYIEGLYNVHIGQYFQVYCAIRIAFNFWRVLQNFPFELHFQFTSTIFTSPTKHALTDSHTYSRSLPSHFPPKHESYQTFTHFPLTALLKAENLIIFRENKKEQHKVTENVRRGDVYTRTSHRKCIIHARTAEKKKLLHFLLCSMVNFSPRKKVFGNAANEERWLKYKTSERMEAKKAAAAAAGAHKKCEGILDALCKYYANALEFRGQHCIFRWLVGSSSSSTKLPQV